MAENSEDVKAAGLSAAEQLEVKQFDVLIERERYARNTSQASAKELRWILFLTIGLILPMVVCYVAMPRGQGRLVSTYVTIVAVVVAGWGVFRAIRSNASAKPKGVGILYGLVFAMLFLFYSTMLLSFTYVFDPESGKMLQTPTIVKP